MKKMPTLSRFEDHFWGLMGGKETLGLHMGAKNFKSFYYRNQGNRVYSCIFALQFEYRSLERSIWGRRRLLRFTFCSNVKWISGDHFDKITVCNIYLYYSVFLSIIIGPMVEGDLILDDGERELNLNVPNYDREVLKVWVHKVTGYNIQPW